MRILIIEDHAPARAALTQGLQEAGFAVDAAGNGREGLQLAMAGGYDAVVLDLMLPGLDGLTVLQRLREAGRKTQVLILTAKDGVADRVKGLDVGADDYLVKPFAFPELLARLRALTRRRYDKADPVLRVGDLEVHTHTREARRGGDLLALTPREYTLLELLAMRAGEVVSRADIMAALYDMNADAASNVVDVFVGNVRRKIDPAGRVPLLHTRRGHGYQLGGGL